MNEISQILIVKESATRVADALRVIARVFLVSLFCAAASLAQTAQTNEPDKIKIIAADWFPASIIFYPPANFCEFCGASGAERISRYSRLYRNENPNLNLNSAAPEDRQKFIYRVEIKNLSPKKIVAVVWEYDFFNPITGRLMKAHRFKSDEIIKPNHRKIVSAETLAPPTGVIDAALLGRNPKEPYSEIVSVKELIYADGLKEKVACDYPVSISNRVK